MYKSKLHLHIEEAQSKGLTLMGDDYMGYKFVGNSVLAREYNKALPSLVRSNQLNSLWLKQRKFQALPYEYTQWVQS